MSIFDDEHTIALLREVGDSGREATAADVAGAMQTGRRIRRRRRALQVVGSSGVVGVAVAVMAVGANLQGGGSVDVVRPAGDAPAPNPGDGSDAKAIAAKKAAAGKAAAGKAAAAKGGGVQSGSAYTDLLLKALGPDFHRGSVENHGGQVALTPGTPSAKRLGNGYEASAEVMLFDPSTDGVTLSTFCKPMVEKGLHQDACTARTLSNGRVVQVQRSRAVPDEYVNTRNSTKFGSSNGLNLYFERADHTVVRLTFGAYDQPAATSPAREKVAASWVDGYTDSLAEVVADPGQSPEAATKTTVGQTDHDRDQAILQSALGPSFTLYNGGVVLEPGSQKAAELPTDMYDVSGELSVVSAAAYDAARSASSGAKSWDDVMLDDGPTHRWADVLLWAGRDAARNEMRGEIAVYLKRDDGKYLLANLEVTGHNVTAAESKDNKAVGQWLESLQGALIKAVTDPAAVGTPSTK
jgi:hypothetical protein